MNIEIHDLRVLRAVSRTGSISGAARSLGVNQTCVSRAVQRLERTTGMPVVLRRTDGASLTPVGRLIVDAAESVLPLVDCLLDESGPALSEQAEPQ